jgi:hypothetical protein
MLPGIHDEQIGHQTLLRIVLTVNGSSHGFAKAAK